jgi:hypothetical protein
MQARAVEWVHGVELNTERALGGHEPTQDARLVAGLNKFNPTRSNQGAG